MPKRLGYKTDHKMINIRREWNEKISAENLNASELINGLLEKYWEGQVCPICFSPNIVHHPCFKCDEEYMVCVDQEFSDGREFIANRNCECDIREMYGVDS